MHPEVALDVRSFRRSGAVGLDDQIDALDAWAAGRRKSALELPTLPEVELKAPTWRLGGSIADRLAEIREFDRQGKTRKALARLYDALGPAVVERNSVTCEHWLELVEVDSFSSTILVGVLTITLPARGWLGARETFYHKVKDHLCRTMPERVVEVLSGLR